MSLPPIVHIVGCWRSGTTLLSAILDSQPQIVSTHESVFAIKLIKRFGHSHEFSIQDCSGLAEQVFRDKHVRYIWKTNPQELASSFINHAKLNGGRLSVPDVCKLTYLKYKSPNAKGDIKLIVDKNPIYSCFMPDIKTCYPETRFIFIYRDPVDNTASRMKYRFHSWQNPAVYAHWWNHINNSVLKFTAKKSQNNNVFFLKYEDLAENPEREIPELFKWLNLSFDEDVYHFNKNFLDEKNTYITNLQNALNESGQDFVDTRMQMGENLLNPINPSKIGSGKLILSENACRLIQHISSSVSEDLGYLKEAHLRPHGFYTMFQILLTTAYVKLTTLIHKFRISRFN